MLAWKKLYPGCTHLKPIRAPNTLCVSRPSPSRLSSPLGPPSPFKLYPLFQTTSSNLFHTSSHSKYTVESKPKKNPKSNLRAKLSKSLASSDTLGIKSSSSSSSRINNLKTKLSQNEAQYSIEEMYQKKTPIEHILLRPDTYIGSLVPSKQNQWVYNASKGTVIQKECTYVPGLYKIFDEILVNAADHKQRDPNGMKTIRVNIDEKAGMISIYNDGAGIPVQIHKGEGVYLPELLLGQLLTGSNFNDDIAKVTGGRNGYGAKLANIFSTEFIVETYDQNTGLYYKQVWHDHMSRKSPPIVESRPASSNSGFTKISFKPDLKLFNMKQLHGDDILTLMKRRTYDIAACLPDVKVFLDSHLLPSNFAHLYSVNSKDDLVVTQVNPRWTVGVGATIQPGQMTQLSFVNCIHTLNGGTHVNYIADQVVKYVLDRIKKRFKSLNVTPAQVKNHLVIVIRCLIENPAFDSQTKEKLMTKVENFGSECILDEKFLKDVVSRSGIVEFVTKQAEHLQKQALARTAYTSKRNKLLGIPKLDDANEAGGPKSQQCTLIITEGDSAKSLAVSGLSIVGRDLYGVYPVQGKMLNVREAATPKVVENKEIKDLIQAIGLNPQRTYEDWETDSKTLRYGRVMLMADQDPDGSHIKGLFINFLHHFWPNLLKQDGFLFEFVTPLIKATKKNAKPGSKADTKSFFTMVEYEQWKSKCSDIRDWNVKYYKGLGTNTSIEAKEYFSNLKKHVVEFKWKEEADKLIDMAFNKRFAAERREWLLGYNPSTFVDTSKGFLDYSNFINKELIAFSHYDNVRSIPSVIDGLKPSQRKVLFSAFKRKLHQEIKVVQLAGYVSEQAGYHHGETSLHGTIVNMAQNFVGSNNLPLLVPSGQFGTRLQGGKDAASARYIFTYLSKYARLLFPEDDDHMLKYLDDDGYPIEPEYYVPVIPLLLVNGAEGVGTGWSTSIPSYNPLNIISNIRLMMDSKPMEPMQPFFKGFKGFIKPTKEGGFMTQGIFARTSNGNLRICELPVGKWTNDYKLFLENMVKEKSFVKEYTEYHTDEVVSFLITPTSPEVIESDRQIIERFKLEDYLHVKNMSAFDVSGNLRKFASPLEIISEFYPVRLSFYEKRKDWKMNQLRAVVSKLRNQTKFIEAVVSGQIQLLNQPKNLIIERLQQLGIDRLPSGSSESPSYSYLLSTPLLNLTKENIDQLREECTKKEQDLKVLENTKPIDIWKEDLDRLEEVLRSDPEFTEAPLALGAKPKIPSLPKSSSAQQALEKQKSKSKTKPKKPLTKKVPSIKPILVIPEGSL